MRDLIYLFLLLIPLGAVSQSSINVKAPPYNAVGNGTNNDTAAIQAALTAAVSSHAKLCFPPGTYLVSAPLRSDISESQATAVQNFAIGMCGAKAPWSYDAATAPVQIIASSSWNTAGGNTSVLDLRYSSTVSVSDISVNANGVSNLDGIEFGERDGSSGNYTNVFIDHASAYQANRAWLFQSTAVITAESCQASNSNIGVFLSLSGDADFNGCYVNSNNVNHVMTSGGDQIGSGYFLINSGNLNIRGGKIEWNANGVAIYDAQGVNLQGIQFDWNTTHSILVQGTYGPGHAYASTSINISGNRFLAGGINSDTFSNRTQLTFAEIGSGSVVEATISGNSFRAGCNLAYDQCSTGSVGPTNDPIQLLSNNGNVTVTASGNDFTNDPSQVTYTAAVYGSGAVLNFGSNNRNLPLDIESGGAVNIATHLVGTLTTTASASDTLSAPSVSVGSLCSVQTQNATAATLTGVYVLAVTTAGSVTVHHSATAGGLFTVFCPY